MNFPSQDFDNGVTALCHRTATDDEAAELQAILESSDAARDEYLWQVELHAELALRSASSTAAEGFAEEVLADNRSRLANVPLRRKVRGRRVALAIAAAVLLAVIAGSVGWMLNNLRNPEPNLASSPADPSPPTGSESDDKDPSTTGGVSLEGVYRKTVAFVSAAAAPVIVGTGQADPIELGAHVPYSQAGHTLHVWDWSKSKASRVFKDTRLSPDDKFAVSPDGRWLVWASGAVLDLTSGEKTKLDLGGQFYFDNAGGKLDRIQGLQFTPDGRRLALLLSNLVVTKAEHPLRKQDLATTHSVQVVEFPSAKPVCEFEASFPIAFSQDGKRAASASPADKVDQQVIEHNAETGEVIRKYEPRIREHAYALGWSPDGDRLAVYDGVGEVLVWAAATGELAYRVNVRQSVQSSATLRFSPDDKHLAIGVFQKLYVVDAATGEVEATAATAPASEIHWSADSKTLEVLSNVTVGSLVEGTDKNGQGTLHNMYPQVDKVDFAALRANE